MSKGSFRHTNRKIDIIERKNQLRRQDPLRHPLNGWEGPDIGFGFSYSRIVIRPPSHPNPPTTPPSTHIR